MYCYIFLLFYSKRRYLFFFFFSSRRRHTRCGRDWSSDVCSCDLARIFDAGRIRSGVGDAKESTPGDEDGTSEPSGLRCGGCQGTLKNVPLTTVLAAAGSSVRKSKALPVPRRNRDFKEQDEILKKKRIFRVQLYGSTSLFW